MASSSSAANAANPNTEIAIKIQAQGLTRKFKLPLRDLVPAVLPHKLRAFLGVHQSQSVVFERFSDSSGTYVNLDATNVQAYKTLYRAAKAKLKLRLRAHVGPLPNPPISSLNLSNPSNTLWPQVPDYSSTLESLTNLNFGSSQTLGTTTDVSVPAPSTAQPTLSTVSAPLPQHVVKDIKTFHHAAAALAVEPVAAAVADFCQGQSVQPPPAVAEQRSSAEEKNQAFVKTIRQMDEELRRRIDAHRARQAVLPPYEAEATPSNEKEPLVKEEAKSLGPGFTVASPAKLPAGATFSWSVYCNHCNKNMLDEHFHCNSCENGDYDLCTDCMSQGKHCLDEKHWLIKRYLRDGKVINGETHKVVQSPKTKSTGFVDMPGSFDVEKTVEKKAEEVKKPTRTCNCCIAVLDEDAFVNCRDCKDYDLCQKCLQSGEHGHHPAHTFVPATKLTVLSSHVAALCKPGRNATHAALCDECDCRIVGVRYKCLVCPDWDYCSKCYQKSSLIHRGHRFAPVYESISSQSYHWAPTHVGVYCDGPLCKDKNAYIAGVRYKCAVCDDLDFCAGCEALPNLTHNKTHPLLKFRTPVRGCSITTMVGNDQVRGASQDHASKTQICTVAEVKPTDCPAQTKEKAEIKDITTQTSDEKVLVQEVADEDDLQAHFVKDSISDGTVVSPDRQFIQVWTLRNPGPAAWPAGCSVRFVGGDNMLNIVADQPSSDADFTRATESNVVRRTVEAGDEISFRVLMKAPKREGTAISYWRLKTASGTPFGHRLWCHVSVSSQKPPFDVDQARASAAAFRHALKEHKDRNGEEHTAATLRDIIGRLETLRNDTQPQAAEKEAPVEPAKPQKVKIEVIEPAAAPTTSSAKQTLSFPTLDVESSASSSATEAVTANAATVEDIPAVAPAPAQNEATIFDDAESITVAESIDLSDDSSDDDGFMTEDEYDILDASDHEIV